jgi:hypothetical protein
MIPKNPLTGFWLYLKWTIRSQKCLPVKEQTMSMKAKLGQNPNQNQSRTFVPAAPSNNRTPSEPKQEGPSTPTGR